MVDRGRLRARRRRRDEPLEPETGFNVFDFPSIDGSQPAVVGGGDIVVMFKDNPAATRVHRVPRDAGGGGDLGEAGRLLVAEQERRRERLPGRDPRRRRPTALANAETFRFDLSDLQPAAFGGTVGQGLWKIFQDFLKNPDDVDGIAQQMEAAAAKAFE